MRISPDTLAKTTGRVRPSSQKKWFKDHFAIDVPCDEIGPIITEKSFESLISKKLGIKDYLDQQSREERPKVRLEKKSK